MFGLISPMLELSLFTSPLKVEADLVGAVHEPTAHDTPVKLLRAKPFRSHLRQALPDLSRARRPALIAPVLALGPSFLSVMGAGAAKGPFLEASVV